MSKVKRIRGKSQKEYNYWQSPHPIGGLEKLQLISYNLADNPKIDDYLV